MTDKGREETVLTVENPEDDDGFTDDERESDDRGDEERADELDENVFDWAEDMDQKKLVRLVFKAARDGNVGFFKKITGKVKKLVNSKDDVGNTPLHYAARNSDVNMVALLLSLKSKPDAVGQNKMTPAHVAARYGKLDNNNEDPDIVLRTQTLKREANTWETIKLLLDNSKERDLRDKYGYTVLHHAVYKGNLELLKQLEHFKHSINFQSGDEQDNTCLHLAAVHGHHHILSYLLNKGFIRVNQTNREKRTALHLACENSIECTRALLSYQSSKDIIDLGDKLDRTPLLMAVFSGKLETVKLLLDHGATLALKNKAGESPLHACARFGHKDIIELLTLRLAESTSSHFVQPTSEVDGRRKKKWDVVRTISSQIRTIKIIDEQDKLMQTPLFLASKHNQREIVDILLKKGANQSTQDHSRKTPLMIGLLRGHTDIVRMLIKKYNNSDLRMVDTEGKNILHFAIQAEDSTVFKDLLSILQRRRGVVRRLLVGVDHKGNTPLHLASQLGNHGQHFRDLLKHYTHQDYLLKNDIGCTPFHLAVKYGNLLHVQCFLDEDEKTDKIFLLNEKDVDSNTVLHLASMSQSPNQTKILNLLLLKGLNTGERNSFGWTPLSCAASSGNLECLQIILGYCNNNVDLEDNNKTTPLHLAAKKGLCEVFDILLENKADISLKDYKDRNVLELAIFKGQKEMVMNILMCNQWKSVMRSCRALEYGNSKIGYSVLDTPFRLLIRKYPDLAEIALNRCYKLDVQEDEEILEMNFEFIEDTYNYRQMSRQQTTWFHNKNAYEHCSKVEKETFEEPYTSNHGIVMWNHPLIIMGRENTSDLLRHPLCLSLLRHKWNTLGVKLYYFSLLFYVAFLAALTTYTYTMPNPANYPMFYDCSDYFLGANFTSLPMEQERVHRDANNVAWYFLVVFFGARALQFVLLQEFTAYIKFVRGLLVHDLRIPYAPFFDLVVYAMLLVVLIDDRGEFLDIDSGDGYLVELRRCDIYSMSAVLIMLAWLNMLTYMRLLPLVGSYIIIFHDVLYTFMTFFLVFVIFVVAFGLGFNMLFLYQEPFRSLPDSVLKTLIMMSGEFDYGTIFLREGEEAMGPVPFPFVSYAVFIVFFVLLSIITLNLLVGLTVDDIKTFLDDADLKKIKMRLKYVLEIEKSRRLDSFLGSNYFKIQQKSIKKSKSVFRSDDVISKKRIWEHAISKRIDNIKKENLDVIFEEQKQMKNKLNKIEKLLGTLLERSAASEEESKKKPSFFKL